MSTFALLAQHDGGEIFAGATAFVIFFWVVGLALTVFWLWMLVDVVMSPMPVNEKILWFLVIFFLHFIGALIYLFARKAQPSRSTI